jgi:hypothetical protein
MVEQRYGRSIELANEPHDHRACPALAANDKLP